MRGKLFLLVTIATVVGLSYCFFISQAYPFVLASEVARTSLEVTAEQTAELNAAKYASDLIAFSIFGALLCSIVAIVGSHPGGFARRLKTLAVACVIGALAGVAMGVVGYLFRDAMDDAISDPMVHVFARLATMFIPIEFAVGLTMALSNRSKQTMLNATMGAVVGGLFASVLYGILSGLVTPLEIVNFVLPAHTSNRYLLFLSAFILIPVVSFLQVSRADVPKVVEIAKPA